MLDTDIRFDPIESIKQIFKFNFLSPGIEYMETDRQTDKARHWKSGIFDKEDNWSALKTPPDGWKVYTKLEICPTTQREHYQTHVDCGTQQRLSALTKWLKHTKWFAVRGLDHIKNSINYISKLDTTAEGAEVQIITGQTYMRFSDILFTVALHAPPPRVLTDEDIKAKVERDPWARACGPLVQMDITWINKLANPALASAWKNFSHIIREHVMIFDEVESGGFIIEPPEAEEIPDACQIIMDDLSIDAQGSSS